tara:strand:- start:2998 stop:3270 length:273 start_codon:yes stop_codon:yes gene_type:complete
MNKATIGLLIIFQFAWTWTLSLYIRLGWSSPTVYLPQMLSDLENLGAWAFLIDAIFLLALYFVIKPHYLRRRGTSEDASGDEPLDNKTDN